MQDNNLQENIESIASSTLIDVLDVIKNDIADARKGDWTTEARKLAIDALDKTLYNKVKAVINNKTKPKKEGENWI